MRENKPSQSSDWLFIAQVMLLFFNKKFKNILRILATYNEKISILSDLNFHLEQPDNTDAQTFLNILRSHGFDSSTNQLTYNQGGWIDVLASRKSVHIDYIDRDIFE